MFFFVFLFFFCWFQKIYRNRIFLLLDNLNFLNNSLLEENLSEHADSERKELIKLLDNLIYRLNQEGPENFSGKPANKEGRSFSIMKMIGMLIWYITGTASKIRIYHNFCADNVTAISILWREGITFSLQRKTCKVLATETVGQYDEDLESWPSINQNTTKKQEPKVCAIL